MNFRFIAGDVGDGKKFAQLAHDTVLVGQAIGADLLDDTLRWRQDAFGFDFAANGQLRRCWQCAQHGNGDR
jgi:hypothetical protein